MTIDVAAPFSRPIMRFPGSIFVPAPKWRILLALSLAYAVQVICFPANANGPFFQRLLDVAPWLGQVETRLLLGAGGYLLAMALFSWSAPALSYRGAAGDGKQVATTNRFIALALAVPAAFLWGLSLIRFALTGEDAMTRWLWLASMGVWLAGVGALAWRKSPHLHSPDFRWRHGLALVMILAGAAWLRFHLLAAIPNDLHGDMASMGLQARAILAGAAPGIFHQGWADIPMLGFYPSVIGLKVIANSILGLNFMPAVEGVLTILGLYLLVWRLFDTHLLAALAAAILAVNIPHNHFSRLAAYMDPWPWLLFATLLLVHGVRVRRLWPFALAGLLLGVGLQMYYSARVVLVILPAAWLYLLLVTWPAAQRRRRFWLAGMSLTALGALIALGPSLLYFWQHTGPLIERSRAVFLFHPAVMTHLMGKYGVETPGAVLWEQIKASALMFNASHDTSTQFGYTAPMFSAALSPLVLLGIGYSLRHWRHPGLGFILIWLGAIFVTGSVLTNNAPFWPRLVGLLPMAALMAGLSAFVSVRAWGHYPRLSLTTVSPETVLGWTLALGIVLVGQQNGADYFRTVSNNARPRTLIGRYLDALPDDITACSFSQPYRLSDREIAFLAWPHLLVDVPPTASGPALNACPGPNRVWILDPALDDQLQRLQQQWPQGELRLHYDRARRLVFRSYLAFGEGTTPVLETPAAAGAYLPDGHAFAPQQTWLGDTSSAATRWRVGPVRVTQGKLVLLIGPVAGHDAVYDYIELLDAQGQVHRFEAEDGSVTQGDVFAARDALDNHWWLQSFGVFSQGRALVARKGEMVPVLTTTMTLPDGLYDLSIGTFTGDPANGVFGLGIRIR